MAVALLLMMGACEGQSGAVRGHVVDVQSESLLELTSAEIMDGDGKRWRFEARGFSDSAEFTPSHLREHMVLGEPVTVKYHDEDGVLVIDDITD
jgi:hypothetical protein